MTVFNRHQFKTIIVFILLVVVTALGIYWFVDYMTTSESKILTIFCDQSLKHPVEDIGEAFQRRTGIKIELDFAPVDLLQDRISGGQNVDIFLTGNNYFLQEMKQQELVADVEKVARMVPVIMVRRGNPAGIEKLQDLINFHLQLAIGEEGTNIGNLSREIFKKNVISLTHLEANITFTGKIEEDLARAVELGYVDAALIWRQLAVQYSRNSQFVEIKTENNIKFPVKVVRLKESSNLQKAAEFGEFLSSTFAQQTFQRYQYDINISD